MQIPRRVETFAQRCNHDSPPTRQKLKQIQVIKDDSFPICNEEIEDLNHAFFKCPKLEATWKSRMPIFAQSMSTIAIMDQVHKVQDVSNITKLEKIFMIAWQFWKRRNRKTFENKLIHLDIATNQAISLLKDFKQQLPNVTQKQSMTKSGWQ